MIKVTQKNTEKSLDIFSDYRILPRPNRNYGMLLQTIFLLKRIL